MNAVPPAQPQMVVQDLEKATSMVMTARRLLITGTTVDLSALETRVRQVCDGVMDLPRELGQGLIPALERLIMDLDHLADMVADRMDPPPPEYADPVSDPDPEVP